MEMFCEKCHESVYTHHESNVHVEDVRTALNDDIRYKLCYSADYFCPICGHITKFERSVELSFEKLAKLYEDKKL